MKFENWDVRGFDREVAKKFHCREKFNPLVSVFLATRGISDIKEAQILTGDIPGEIYDPFLLKDMDIAVKRIYEALENNERIAIFGDYDVDGMTSCAVLCLWLK